MPYNFDHWDRAIRDYREIERSEWSPEAEIIINRIRSQAFRPDDQLLSQTHVLDIAKTGYIMPHVDSVKFVGRALAGLSLISDSVIRFRKARQ